MLNCQVLIEKLPQIKEKQKHLLAENELKKMRLYNWEYSIGKITFEEDGNYLVFQPINRYFKTIAGVGNDSYTYYWQSKGLSDEIINSIKTPNYSTTPSLDYHGTKTRVEFNGTCLKQGKVIFNHGKEVNINVVYEISKSINISDYTTLKNCLFGAVSLTKNADIDKYGYSEYGIGFYRHGSVSFPGTGLGRNVIIFRADMSPSTKIDNRKKDILILGKSLTQGLEHILSAEKCIRLILQSIIKSSASVCIIMEQIVICFLMVKKL